MVARRSIVANEVLSFDYVTTEWSMARSLLLPWTDCWKKNTDTPTCHCMGVEWICVCQVVVCVSSGSVCVCVEWMCLSTGQCMPMSVSVHLCVGAPGSENAYLVNLRPLFSAFRCLCGAPECRGLIQGFKHLDAQQRRQVFVRVGVCLRARTVFV